MANITQGVRQNPVPADPKELAHVRNREDSIVLGLVLAEVNLRGGDSVDVSEDYTALPTDRYLFADSSGGIVAITFPDASDLTGKHLTVIRSGGNDVTTEDAVGALHTLSSDGDAFGYVAHGGVWLRVSR